MRRFEGGVDARGQRVANVGTPTNSADGVPKSFIRYDIAPFCAGKPAASEVLMLFAAPVACSFVVSLSGSVAKSGTAATSSATFTLTLNGSAVGTIVFGAGSKVASFSSSGFSMAVGDILSLTAPATQDGTLADIAFTLVAAR